MAEGETKFGESTADIADARTLRRGGRMKKIIRGIMVVVFSCVLLTAGAVWYIQPVKKMDLAYSELPLVNKAASILLNRKPEVVLSEQEVSNLLKKALAQHPAIDPHVTVTGAEFFLQGQRLTANMNLLLYDRLEAGATLFFDLSWQEPYLMMEHTGTEIRQAAIPLKWFQLEPRQIQLNDFLPKPMTVRDVAFEGSSVKISLKLR